MNYKETLKKQYKYRIEMHAHTMPISGCSEISPAEMAEIYHSKGYDAIVITNHFYKNSYGKDLPKEEFLASYLNAYEETAHEAKKYGLDVLLGAEIRFTENTNDYLMYGVDKGILSTACDYFEKGLRAYRTEVSLPDTVFVQAHPFRNGCSLIDTDLLDGIEAFNMHPGHNSPIGFGVRAAYNSNASIITIGSDFHHKSRGHEAVSALRTKVLPKNSFELAKILKNGDYIFEVGENSIILP